jgi:glycosyltransferase involved in cell wall biosynthesis
MPAAGAAPSDGGPFLAFFDDYGDEPGHHPDLILGLGRVADEPVFCPASFAAPLPPNGHPVTPSIRDAATTRANVGAASDRSEDLGVDVVVNLFLDENIEGLPSSRRPMAHVLHRPQEMVWRLEEEVPELPVERIGDVLTVAGRPEPVVVHTVRAHQQATALLPGHPVVRLGWPSASAAEVRRRFEAEPPSGDPYVVLIGEALPYKQVRWLVEALGPALPLHVAGALHDADRAWLARHHPGREVRSEPGWVRPERMEALIAGSAVVAFPYWPEFTEHGGVSAALVQALTFAKPIVVTPAIADQVPSSEACTVVPDGDVDALATALAQAVDERDERHRAARSLLGTVLRSHTYEAHHAGLRDVVRLLVEGAQPPAR